LTDGRKRTCGKSAKRDHGGLYFGVVKNPSSSEYYYYVFEFDGLQDVTAYQDQRSRFVIAFVTN